MMPRRTRPAADPAPQPASAPVETAEVFGIPVTKLDLSGLLGRVRKAVATRAQPPLTIAYVNALTCNLSLDDPTYRRALLSTRLIYADGNGPRIAARLAGERIPRRMTGADWIYDLAALCAREGWALYFLGAAPGVAAEAARRLGARHPGLRVVGLHHGFFEEGDTTAILEDIGRQQPDILLIAMGSPRQEIWMADRAATLAVPVVWTVGGVLDFASGRVRRAPRWMCQTGLEWLGRALIEPRRLGSRYLVGIPRFLFHALVYALAARRIRHHLHAFSKREVVSGHDGKSPKISSRR